MKSCQKRCKILLNVSINVRFQVSVRNINSFHQVAMSSHHSSFASDHFLLYCSNSYRPQRSFGKVIFSQASVSHSVHRGEVCAGRACMAGDVCGRGHVWWESFMGGIRGRGVCLVRGVHGGGNAWQGGTCGGGHAWQAPAPLADTTKYGQ